MAFTLQIKQKKLFGKAKLDISALARSCGFKYGSDDDFFILQEGQENNKTAIFYNPNRIGRGFFFNGTKGENGFYEMSYNIPTTRGEIIDFTRLIQEVERRLGKVEMYCVEEGRILRTLSRRYMISNRGMCIMPNRRCCKKVVQRR